MSEADKAHLIRRRVLIATVSNYAGQLASMATGFLLTPFILRAVGPSAYGIRVLVGSLIAYGSLLDLGIGTATTKYVAEHRARGEYSRTREIVATSFALYAGLGAVAFALSCVAAVLFPAAFKVPAEEHTSASWVVLLMGLGLGLSIPATTTFAVLRGLHRFDLANAVSIGATLFSGAATICVLVLNAGLVGLAVANGLTSLAVLVASLVLVRRVAPELSSGWRGARRALVRPVLGFGASVFLAGLGSRLQTRTDEIVIGSFLPISSVTPYSIARRLSEVPQLLTTQFLKAFLPLASELHAQGDQARLRALFVTGTRLTLAVSISLGLVLAMLARPIIATWVGAEYGDSAYLVAILLGASLIATSLWPGGSILQGMARHRPLAIASLVSGMLNLVLSIALVGPLGLSGVALGTLVATAVVDGGFVLPYVLREIGVGLPEIGRNALLPALLPSAPAALVLAGLQLLVRAPGLLELAAISVAGLATYGLIYLLVGARSAERDLLRAFLAKSAQLLRGRSLRRV